MAESTFEHDLATNKISLVVKDMLFQTFRTFPKSLKGTASQFIQQQTFSIIINIININGFEDTHKYFGWGYNYFYVF